MARAGAGLVLACSLLACVLDAASAECCDGFVMSLRTAPDTPDHEVWPGISLNRDDRVAGCASGRRREGSYCGVGSCNIFGCNCDGGCIRGRTFEVPTIGYHRSLAFYCDADVPDDLGQEDVARLVNHRGCTCSSANTPGSEFTLAATVVEGPEQDASDPLHCDKGMVYCEVDVRHVRSFGVTTSLSYTGGVNLVKVPADFSMTYTTEWSTSTSTESGHHCTAEGGGATWLRIKPKYYNVTVITRIPRLENGRNYCEVKQVYVPKTNPDGSIAGDRRCAYRKTDRSHCPRRYPSTTLPSPTVKTAGCSGDQFCSHV
ncbi:hypothetical protein ONE63_003605 [Megalurothrips usitatus]|uniref:Uncharacterized protein n=1 Tax=Megalurothrips usitatus TaxID=439358 RepID=A0AAV7X3I8_9NEOP|nr:hypothetical protein ONE63_003605 [Megalurothrips usitatus]